MDIPDLPPADLGDLGTALSGPSTPFNPVHDPPPARSSSPPLPPRKDALGLPPSYLTHLKGLLHQWLQQQVDTEREGGVGDAEYPRLWDDRRLGEIENAIWAGAVVSDKAEGRTRLLDLEWATWAPGAAKRKEKWRSAHSSVQPDGFGKQINARQAKRSHSVNQDEGYRGRLSAPPTGTLPQSSTPQRLTTRPPSIASAERTRSPLRAGPVPEELDALDPVEKQRQFCSQISGLRGFQPLLTQNKDEWEVLEDNLPLPEFNDKEVPGAFPQTAHLREPSLPSAAPPLPPKANLIRPFIGVDDLVKPLFCVHFAAPLSNASTSTLHLRRQSSLGSSSTRVDSTGSDGGKWWNASGSGRSWSGIGLGISREIEENVSVEFTEGRFALPSIARASSSPRRRRPSLKTKGRSASSSTATPSGTEQSNGSADEEDADDASSNWSGTQRASAFRARAMNLFIGDDQDDLPLESVSDIVLVGGTVQIRGIHRESERSALQKILAVLLEVFDAFRIPRELDIVAVPMKPLPSRQQSSPVTTRSASPSLHRTTTFKERGEKTRGFFQRLGRDTRGMIDNLIGKPKSSENSGTSINREDTISSTETTLRSSHELQAQTAPTAGLATNSTSQHSQPADRHLQTLTKLEMILPSTTPSLRIPMPPILLRVREEEKVRADKARSEVQSESIGLANNVIDGLTRLASTSSPRDDSSKVRARGYRMGGDVRAGLASLSSGMDQFEGWPRFQKLEVLVATGLEYRNESSKLQTTVCERPKPQLIEFWGEGDETIQDIMDSFQDGEHVCRRPGCHASQEEHIRWYFHNSQKVGLTFRKAEQGMGENGLDAWIKCPMCLKTSEPRKLGNCVSVFSWGKFLELLLYTSILRPTDFCPHAKDLPTPLTVQIRAPHIVLTIEIRPVSVLDARLPKLQVGPNVSKRKAGRTGAVGAVDGLIKADRKSLLEQDLRADIAKIIAALKFRLDMMKSLSATSSPASLDAVKSMETSSQALSPVRNLDDIESEMDNLAQTLSNAIARCIPGHINDVRQEILAAYRRYTGSLDAIQKQLRIKDAPEPEDLPAYFGSQVHALPGSSVLLRESEPSSIIAHTLSSVAYFAELTNCGRPASEEPTPAAGEGEGWIIEVIRKDTPRDLLSLRTITKKRSDASMAKSEHKLPLSVAPNQPSLELSLEQVEGKSQATDRLDDLVRSISRATAQDPVLTMKARSPSMSESDTGYSSPRVPPSMMRRTSETVKVAPPSAFRPTRSVSGTVPSTPTIGTPGTISGATTPRSSTPVQEGGKDGWSSVTSTFTSSFNNLMKMGSDVGSFRMRGNDRSLSSLIGPLSMLSNMDNSLTTTNIDDRPHIQFTYTLPDKVKIGCTIYYATAFDSLRRRCVIDRSILESLSRCESWDAQGGKSKAAFYMTGDKRYIVKELVSKWNVSDTQALLEIAPSYFEHLANTHNKATSLAKIVAFTTVRIHDLQTSTKKTMDLMIMENLFYKQNISQTFDLKGIEGRKVPKSMGDGSTLFDSEWIEGQSRAPILLHPHAKRILQEAIYNDTRYLCSQSIMDYSLLLGLDNGRKELVVGLVDAIGSYNLFKTIESRGKLALTRGGEVTIIPPDQYRERFESAMKQYFIACPDKWSKPARRRQMPSHTLPNIL